MTNMTAEPRAQGDGTGAARRWRKAPTALVDLFERSVPDDPRVTRRQMFGYPAAFAGGNLFMSLHQDDFVIRLAADDRARFTASFGPRPFAPMPGRAMRDYVRLPDTVLADAQARADWVGRALRHALALPEKPAKPRRRRRAP